MLRSLVVAALSLAAGEALAQETSFLLINGTGYPISQLAVSPTDINFWTPNVLPAPPIKAGERRQVRFNAPTTYCQADMKIGFADNGAPAVLAKPQSLQPDQDQAGLRPRERYHHGELRRLEGIRGSFCSSRRRQKWRALRSLCHPERSEGSHGRPTRTMFAGLKRR